MTADPFGMTTKKTKATAKEERQRQLQKRNTGSLHCAVHDEAVNSFGRDDVPYYWLGKRTKMTADPFGDDNKKDKGNCKRRETKATAGEERQRQLQKRNTGVSPLRCSR
ncbi:hypothetical protein [Tunturiibacter gelidiferens]|uniref:hypothetical protein n=1 Tax=Tunturiibacter gelidiferens TaxID=3069689 RepID=UPI003D9BB968